MPPLGRLARALALALAGLVYVWIAAVRNTPRVKARKAARRRARGAERRERSGSKPLW